MRELKTFLTNLKRTQVDKTYNAWHNMKQRCLNENNPGYDNYGGRGITVCERWLSYTYFIEDMGVCPKNLTLERINNEEGYCKENCKWASYPEQGLNKRIFRTNTTGITGVYYHKRDKAWSAQTQIGDTTYNLYYGKDFFEACCARKSWEGVQKGLNT